MLKFLIDEDMPRSTGKTLAAMGFEVLDARDCGLRGKSDDEVYDFAQTEGAILLTGDMGFANLLRFSPGLHCGIVVAHFPSELSVAEMNRQISMALETLTEEDFKGNLVVLEPGRTRIRRTTA